jgi:hypothetical protein
MVSGLPWEDPRSFRKPTLFGISTGLTLASLLILLDDLKSRHRDLAIRVGLCVSLVVEVLLITLQSWRRVPSHFNRATAIDTIIELAMLACILFACVCIGGLAIRVMRADAFRAISRARVLAQQAGMLFLVVSCVLGMAITVLGHYQLATGGSSETYGRQGVLKFPHGAVLHAIQTLVLWSWWCDRVRAKRNELSVMFLAGSHLFFLLYAIRQTSLGRDRWDGDMVAWGLLGWAVLAGILAVFMLLGPREKYR